MYIPCDNDKRKSTTLTFHPFLPYALGRKVSINPTH
jgi:hypothetical protein